METEWDYSGRKERDGQKKKIVNTNGQGEKECPGPMRGSVPQINCNNLQQKLVSFV